VSGPRVVVFYVDAGGGHRSATQALLAAAEERRCAWSLEPVNLQAVLAPLDFTRRLTGLTIEETYNYLLRHRLSWTMGPLMRLLHGIIRLRFGAAVRRLADYLAELTPRPAAVLSVFPNLNGVIRDACHRALPGVPFTVLLTDLADFPPHFWIEPGIDRVVVGSDEAAAQARAARIPADAIVRVSGMVLHPRFYREAPEAARLAMRSEMGIGAETFVVLLLFGGKGSPEMLPLAEGLLAESPDWRVVAIAGQNPDLVARLESLARERSGRLHVIGFTDRVADLMAAADLLVTKPGPGSLAEAWHQRLPVLVSGGRNTIPQERFNVRFVREHELGIVVGHWREVPEAVRTYATDAALRDRIRGRVAGLPRNRAVYEILDLIDAQVAPGAQRT
jgi:UDP-N-acetylglucosamine:LPS N-acetylglucosamine transferase